MTDNLYAVYDPNKEVFLRHTVLDESWHEWFENVREATLDVKQVAEELKDSVLGGDKFVVVRVQLTVHLPTCSPKPNYNGDLVAEGLSHQDFGAFAEKLTLSKDGSLAVQAAYGRAEDGDCSWYHVGPDYEEYDSLFADVKWPVELDEFCNPGTDQTKDLEELLGLSVRFVRHD